MSAFQYKSSIEKTSKAVTDVAPPHMTVFKQTRNRQVHELMRPQEEKTNKQTKNVLIKKDLLRSEHKSTY